MTSTLGPNSLETLPASGPPPKSRVRDASAALSIVMELSRANQARNRKWTLLQGMLDGNPPFSSAELRNSGQAFRSNFASLEGKSLSSAACTPFYELFSGGRTLAEVTLDLPINATPPPDVANRIVSEEFDRRLKEHPSLQIQIWQLLWDYVNFGRAHLMWEDETGWEFKQIKFARVLFPDSTDIDTEHWDYFVIRQEVPIHWLWQRIRDEKSAEARGWNVDACREAIRLAVPHDNAHGWHDYMRIQQDLADNDLYVSSKSRNIKLANLFVREFSGDWSWMVMVEDAMSSSTSGGAANAVAQNQAGVTMQTGPSFLFRKTGAFEAVEQFLLALCKHGFLLYRGVGGETSGRHA